MRKTVVLKTLILVAAVCGLFGCDLLESHTPTVTAVKDYQARIYNILDIELDENKLAPRFEYPKREQLIYQQQAVSVRWTDFFATIDCPDFQQLLSERNSQLGRSADALNQLIYELKFHDYYLKCSINKEALSDKWQQGIAVKQTQFKSEVFNNTWGSHYWQKAFFSGTQKDNREVSFQKVLKSLVSIRTEITPLSLAVNATDNSSSEAKNDINNRQMINTSSIFSAYRELESNSGTLGLLMQDVLSSGFYLEQMNKQLLKHSSSVCPQGIPTQRAEYLVNVLRKFFLQNAQHKISQNLKHVRELETEVGHWKKLMGEYWPQKLEQKFFDPDGQAYSSRLTKTVREHIAAWQQIQNNCGLTIHQNS